MEGCCRMQQHVQCSIPAVSRFWSVQLMCSMHFTQYPHNVPPSVCILMTTSWVKGPFLGVDRIKRLTFRYIGVYMQSVHDM